MSFSRELKTELCDLKTSECCRRAECYGFMLFGQSFNADKISFLTDNEATAALYAKRIRQCFDVICQTEIHNGKKTTYKVWIKSSADRMRIINSLGLSQETCSHTINRTVFIKDCCKNAFIRGTFIACGQAMDPANEYRIDLRIKSPQLAYDLFDILYKRSLEPKITLKSLTNVIYLKRSECVEDFLTLIGAAPLTLKLMNIKAEKDFRSSINRKTNFEDANSSRAVNASVLQRRAINYLIENGKFNALPDELRQAAELRMDNPYAPLSELCRLSPTSITRSGLNHRLQKIIAMAEEFKNRE